MTQRAVELKKLALNTLLILACVFASSLVVFAEQDVVGNGNPNSSAPSTHHASAVSNAEGLPSTDSLNGETPAPANSAYVIGPSDVLTIQVWHEPDLSARALPVRPDGKISLALLNDVQAAGLTPMQLNEEITKGLKRYVADPQVTVVVEAINSKRIYVMGQVQRPGAYPLLPNMSVLQALSGAGGLLQYANPKKIYILRTTTKLPFNYKDALRGKDLGRQPVLEAGDTIVVP